MAAQKTKSKIEIYVTVNSPIELTTEDLTQYIKNLLERHENFDVAQLGQDNRAGMDVEFIDVVSTEIIE